ncbi:MAG: response regulator [Sediminispirochaetaceae bacterium]
MGQYKILIIGESAALRRHINYVLSQQRFMIIEASDINTGLKTIQEEPVYLIIVDSLLPPSSAVRFLQQVRELRGYSAVPILLLRDEKNLLLEIEKLGIPPAASGRILTSDLDFYFLAKPFSRDAMNSMVKKIQQDSFLSSSYYSQPIA